MWIQFVICFTLCKQLEILHTRTNRFDLFSERRKTKRLETTPRNMSNTCSRSKRYVFPYSLLLVHFLYPSYSYHYTSDKHSFITIPVVSMDKLFPTNICVPFCRNNSGMTISLICTPRTSFCVTLGILNASSGFYLPVIGKSGWVTMATVKAYFEASYWSHSRLRFYRPRFITSMIHCDWILYHIMYIYIYMYIYICKRKQRSSVFLSIM